MGVPGGGGHAGQYRLGAALCSIRPRRGTSLAGSFAVHALTLFLIVAATTFDYLAKHAGWLPSNASFAPELVGVITAAYVVAVGAQSQFRFVRPEYWVVFGAIAFVMFCGVIVNSVQSGPLFAGLRVYLRALPFFFLPAVLLVSEPRLRRMMLLVMAIAVIQLPLAIWQRTTNWNKGLLSGDYVIGTIMNSSMLSIWLIGVACVLTALYLRKRMPLRTYLLLLLVVVIPTTLNETKGTIFLLPLGLLTVFIAGSQPGRRLANASKGLAVIVLCAAVFVPIYDYYITPRWGYGIVEFFQMEGRAAGYMHKEAEIGTRGPAGRWDAVKIPLRELSRDPAKLMFGYGIGNVQDSALGEAFTGEYFRRYRPFLLSASSLMMLEIGLFGHALLLVLMWMIFNDARAVARQDKGLYGALALGWIGVMPVMLVSLFYKVMITNSAMSYSFWLFAGLVAAHRMHLAVGARATRTAAPDRVAAARRDPRRPLHGTP
jgi:hypothetical protein